MHERALTDRDLPESATATLDPDDERVGAVLRELSGLGSPEGVAGMARYAIAAERVYGVSMPALKQMARRLGRSHTLAERLFATGVYEARIIASLVDDPKQIDDAQMERWVARLENWADCDACCGNLFAHSPLAYRKIEEWSGRREEIVKRAAFATIAALAVHDKRAADEPFLRFLALVETASDDDRHLVKKAVNWALRQIGKRNRTLHAAAIRTAEAIRAKGTRSGRWIAADALRELRSEAVLRRLGA